MGYFRCTINALVAVAAGIGVPGPLALAEEPATEEPAAPATPVVALSRAEVASLVTQLGDEKYAVREAASEQLVRGNAAVVGHLRNHLQPDQPEINYRIIGVLAELRDSEDDATRSAALSALKQLTKSDDTTIAGRARESLFPPVVDEVDGLGGQAVIFGGLRNVELGGGGGITITGGTVRIGGRSQIVQSSLEDGVQTVVVHQGIGRKITMRIDEAGIDVRIYRRDEEGRPMRLVYQAIDEVDLQLNHPEGYKIYLDFKGYKGGTVMNGMPKD
ncbi:MAG: hypothetical protein DWQ31_14210 [Planctomycetota bacterium]|nr:MAG: hypothetical protein DWQ31_14210 [Planctomycetota bacterium]REJ94523.1 MAG: hypothetical protein DWQ35_07915 [Planctomycetota bacterium]